MKAKINVDHIARIEGHGNVHVVIEDDEVKKVQMEVVEPARLFESMVRGHALERCSELCRRLAADEFEGSSAPAPFEVRAGRGVGYTEAPRGVVLHELELDDDGRVVHASIITPTSQNVAVMEDDMRQLAELMISQGADEPAIKLRVEELVRAYDPCLSCSVH